MSRRGSMTAKRRIKNRGRMGSAYQSPRSCAATLSVSARALTIGRHWAPKDRRARGERMAPETEGQASSASAPRRSLRLDSITSRPLRNILNRPFLVILSYAAKACMRHRSSRRDRTARSRQNTSRWFQIWAKPRSGGACGKFILGNTGRT